nr:hypothetical protein CFP56_64219 [Quercus suber]
MGSVNCIRYDLTEENSDNIHIKFNYITKIHRKLDLKAGSLEPKLKVKTYYKVVFKKKPTKKKEEESRLEL